MYPYVDSDGKDIFIGDLVRFEKKIWMVSRLLGSDEEYKVRIIRFGLSGMNVHFALPSDLTVIDS